MKKTQLATALLCFTVISFSSCKKKNDDKKTTCTSTLYGFSSTYNATTCSFGSINPATHSLAVADTFSGTTGAAHATYNTSDHCYYVFQGAVLYKITLAGVVSTYTTTATDVTYEGIIYNPSDNKLYAIRRLTGSSTIVTLSVSGTMYSGAVVTPTVGYVYWSSPASTTVNAATGTIYYSSRNATANTFSIEKYTPGASAPSVIASGSNQGILGLQFNKNDNMLYAIREGAVPADFIKIDPASGTITSLGTLSFPVNDELYTSVIDDCSNHYIVTSMIGAVSCSFSQLSMTGTVIQHDTATGIYQGFTEVY